MCGESGYVTFEERERLNKEIERLTKINRQLDTDSTLLHILIEYGVDNWEGFSDAMAEFNRTMETSK